jgi:hypothetical protein
MGISNISSNLRPGICTSSTRPTTPYEGQVIYETDTNRTLVWDNSAWVDPSTGQTQRSGLVKMKPNAVSTGATINTDGSVTFSGQVSYEIREVFTSSFDNYRIIISNFMSGGTTTRNIAMQLMAGTTAATGSNYNYGAYYIYSTTVGNFAQVNQSDFRIGGSSNQAGAVGNYVIDVIEPNIARKTSMQYTSTTYEAAVTQYVFRTGYCAHWLDTAYNGFKLFGTTDNIEGKITVYGYN